MFSRLILLAAFAAVGAQAPLAPPPPAVAQADLVKVAILTSEGRMVVALDRGHAPLTVANFLHYVDAKRYDGQSFYRAMPYTKGGLSMARLEPGSARSDFFILTEDIPAFDATAADPGFAAFGNVVEGLDVADKIFADPRSPTKGAGVMKGQMLDPAVKIVRVTRVK
jgi:peptidyl-prolyl cis-trans isomerase A (cyclophilin A)